MSELRNLDWLAIIDRIAKFATCDWARSEIKKIGPLASPEVARESFACIADYSQIIKTGVRPYTESLDLVGTWLQRLTRHAVLKPLELKDVRHFCLEAIALKETVKPIRSRYLHNLFERIMNADEPLSAIDQIMTAQGDIRNDASEKLFHLNEEKSQLARQVHTTLNRLVKDYHLEHLLQDRFVTTREGRWVLPIKSGMQHGFSGIVHDASQSKQTVFMEPQEVVPVNNRLREIEIEIEQEIEKLLMELSQYLHSIHGQFAQTRDALLESDIQLAKAQLMVQLNANPCEFSSKSVHLKGVGHPLLILNAKKIVANDIDLDANKRILLLSGPNAGGKTVLLKSIGLAAQMARCGLPICAEVGSSLPFFTKVVVALGDSQSVDADLSTFAAHLKSLEEATACRSAENLILIDEICGSTDPEEGAALARSFISVYSENGVFGIITSHLGALKMGWQENSGIVNGSLEFDQTSGPTYRFIMGVPGQSLAIRTAQRVGIKKDIITRALNNLSPEVRKYQEGLNDLDKMKHELLTMQDHLSKELKSTEKEKYKYRTLLDKFNEERENKLDNEVRKAAKKVEELIQQANVKDVFARHEALQKIKFDLPEVIKGVSSTATVENKGISTADDFLKAFPPGSNVHIVSLGRDGIIQSAANAKGEVAVLSNSMRLMVSWRDLKPPLHVQNPTQNVLRKKGFAQYSAVDSDRIVDVRGLSADEAISQLEIQLDTASLASEDRVKVIHGHGTDTLKRTIRNYLSRSVYVKTWLAGTPENGGDGITWIEIK